MNRHLTSWAVAVILLIGVVVAFLMAKVPNAADPARSVARDAMSSPDPNQVEAVASSAQQPHPAAPRTDAPALSIVFPDGTSVPVRLTHAPMPGVRIAGDYEKFATFHDELAGRALKGDAAAAHELYRQLERCKRVHADEGSLDTAVRRLRDERVITRADGSSSEVVLPGVDIASVEESELRKPFEFCSGITSDQKAKATEWLQMAVDAGNYWALKDWAMARRGTPDELKAWESLWQQGHATVLPALKNLHAKGAGDSPPDFIRAYAYKYIEFQLLQAAYRDAPSPQRTSVLVSVENALHETGALLTPQDTESAVQLAKEILLDNPKCCVGSW